VLDALLQLPLAVGVTALHLASRGSLPLCVAFHTAAAAAARAYAGPLARQVLRTGAGAAGAGSATSGVADPLGALAAESGASGVAAGLWATLANPGRGAGARGADAAEGWNRVDAASALLMGAYVAALPAFAYLLANGAARRRRVAVPRRTLRRRRVRGTWIPWSAARCGRPRRAHPCGRQRDRRLRAHFELLTRGDDSEGTRCEATNASAPPQPAP
jgi:hypothetical protein